jgi:hypothetical protein
MRNPYFTRALDEMEAIHERKNHDYASDTNPFSNFEFAARFAGVTVDQVFAVMEGIKQARILELTLAGKAPNNESLDDSLKDGAVYPALRYAYHLWAQDGRPMMSPAHALPPPDPQSEAEAISVVEPSFLATLDTIDQMMVTSAQRAALLNTKRHIFTAPTPPSALEGAEFRVEGD